MNLRVHSGLAYARELARTNPDIYPILKRPDARPMFAAADELLTAAQNGHTPELLECLAILLDEHRRILDENFRRDNVTRATDNNKPHRTARDILLAGPDRKARAKRRVTRRK